MHDFEERKVLLKANLERHNRGLVPKQKSGILSLPLETDCYEGVSREYRTCQLCDTAAVEDKIHFLFMRKKLKSVRKAYVKGIRKEYPSLHKKAYIGMFKVMLDSKHIKEFGVWLERMVLARRDIK